MRPHALLLLLCLICVPLVAQETAPLSKRGADAQAVPLDTPSPTAADDGTSAIRAASRKFVAAFNQRDAEAIAKLWAKNAEYIDDVGRRIAGRDAIEKAYASFFEENPHSTMRVMIDSIRLLSDSAAIEDGRAVVDPPPPGIPGFNKYTAVHVKVGGKWLMASVRDTHVETPSAYRNVADLEFLIGTWTAEDQGNKTVSVCRWVANKSFVQRDYAITSVDGTKTAGVQIIGWNADEGHVQSWNFSPDGGHAIGAWTPAEEGWTAEMRGVTGDGIITTSVNTLKRLDDNAYVWQSTQRTAGDVSLPDTDEVVLKRQQSGQ